MKIRLPLKISTFVALAWVVALDDSFVARAETRERCLERLRLMRATSASAAQQIRPGSASEKHILLFCTAVLPKEGADCVFDNLSQGGRLAGSPDTSIALCRNGWDAPRDCMADLFQKGIDEGGGLLGISQICRIPDPEGRQCAIARLRAPETLHVVIDACREKQPEVRSCMLDFIDKKPPFDVAKALTRSDAQDLCQYWSWAGAEARACLIHFYKKEPPFDKGLIKFKDQALLVCGFGDATEQRCMLDAIISGDRKRLTDCLKAPLKTDAEKKACVDYVWIQTHSEKKSKEICSLGNTELRRCVVEKIMSEDLPFEKAFLLCAWEDVNLLMKAVPTDCPK